MWAALRQFTVEQWTLVTVASSAVGTLILGVANFIRTGRVETKTTNIEHNTNSMKDALVKTTGEKAFEAGRKDVHDEQRQSAENKLPVS